MARVSSAPEDAFHFKGTFADGWGEVIDAKAVVFQFPPTKEASGNRPAGSQDPPGLFAALTIQRHIDDQGNKSAEQPEEVLLSIQRASRDTGNLDTCHPGNFPDGNLSVDPEDAGGELGAVGNTLFASQDGFQLNDKTKWMSFTASLQEDGFKPEILKRTYFPDLIGLRAYFTTLTRPKFRDDQTSDPTVFVVKKGSTRVYPYEKGAVKPSGKGKTTAAATTGKTNAKPATNAAATGAAQSASDLSAEDLALAIVQEVSAKQKGAVLPDMKKAKVNFYMGINAHKPPVPPELKKDVQNQLGDEEWLEAQGAMNNLFTVGVDGQVSFA